MKREELMEFYIKHEIGRRRRAPSFDRAQVRNGIERRIYFDHFKMLRVPTESFMRRHFFWIPSLDKSRVAPARGPDQDFVSPIHSLTEPSVCANANPGSCQKLLLVARVIENELRVQIVEQLLEIFQIDWFLQNRDCSDVFKVGLWSAG